MRVLITGIGGLLGSRFASYLLNKDVTIVGIDDFSCGYVENVPPGVYLQEYTLGTNSKLKLGHFDYIFHFAAHAAECLSPFTRIHNYKNNILATAEVINNAINTGADRVIFTSSIAVYGNSKAPFDEKDICIPNDPYGVAKLACESDLRIMYEQHGIEYCILRPHNIFGVKQDLWNPYRNVLGIWMAQAKRGEPFTIYGDGKQKRAFTPIENCLPCIWQAAVSPKVKNEIINLGGNDPISVLELYEIVSNITGQKDIKYLPARHEVKDAWCTSEKAVNLLGYKETISLYEGVLKMWHWAEKQKPKISLYPQYEVTKGLPKNWEWLQVDRSSLT